jgi:hypothetical protein
MLATTATFYADHGLARPALVRHLAAVAPRNPIDLNLLASGLAGRAVVVACVPNSESHGHNGWTFATSADGGATWQFAAQITMLKRYCDALVTIRSPHAALSFDAGEAILTLGHEALHIRLGSIDEGVVECGSYRNLWPTIAALRVAPSMARSLLILAQGSHTARPLVNADGTPNPYRSVC